MRDLAPSLLIVDKSFGSQAVLDWISGPRVSDSPATVVVWSSTLSESEAVRFLQAGVNGIVRKTTELQALLRCICCVAAGGTGMDDALMPESSRPVRCSTSPLIVRELQVMDLVERGFKNKEIAFSLGRQTGAVKIIRSIFSRRQAFAVAMGRRSGLKEKRMLRAAAEAPN